MAEQDQSVTPAQETALRSLAVWRGADKTAIALKRKRKSSRDQRVIVECAAAESAEWQEREKLRNAADKLDGEH